MITVRERIVLRMKELKVSNKQMCADLGLTEANTSAYLHGNRAMPYGSLEAICFYLGLAPKGREREDS